MRTRRFPAIVCGAFACVFFSVQAAVAITSDKWQQWSESDQIAYVSGAADFLIFIGGHIKDQGGAKTNTERALVDRADCGLSNRLTYSQLRQILMQYLSNYPDKRGYGVVSNLLAAIGKHCNQY